MIETGVDVLLALLHARGATGKMNEPVLGITRLQKLLFLLWKEGKFYKAVPELYNFKAYDFGPCMDDLYDDLEFSQSIKLIRVEETEETSEYENGDGNVVYAFARPANAKAEVQTRLLFGAQWQRRGSRTLCCPHKQRQAGTSFDQAALQSNAIFRPLALCLQ